MFQTREEDYIVHLWYMHKKCKLFGEKKSLSTYSLSTTVSWNSTHTHHPSTRFSKLPSVFRTGFMAICSIYCNANLNKLAFFPPPPTNRNLNAGQISSNKCDKCGYGEVGGIACWWCQQQYSAQTLAHNVGLQTWLLIDGDALTFAFDSFVVCFFSVKNNF